MEKINLPVFQINPLTTLKGKERKKGLFQAIYEHSREGGEREGLSTGGEAILRRLLMLQRIKQTIECVDSFEVFAVEGGHTNMEWGETRSSPAGVDWNGRY